MLPNMNPSQMRKMMQQFGIKNEEIDSARVLIEKTDGSLIEILEPSVIAIDMQGQKSFQISGKVSERAGAGGATEKSDADVVAEQTGCSKEEAQKALDESNGDLAEAIMKLTK